VNNRKQCERKTENPWEWPHKEWPYFIPKSEGVKLQSDSRGGVWREIKFFKGEFKEPEGPIQTKATAVSRMIFEDRQASWDAPIWRLGSS
jgi:hypothetical protein